MPTNTAGQSHEGPVIIAPGTQIAEASSDAATLGPIYSYAKTHIATQQGAPGAVVEVPLTLKYGKSNFPQAGKGFCATAAFEGRVR